MEERTIKHEYVDLGLSVKWATCNIGAERPEDCGDYFAWGEIETKDNYTWDSYKWGIYNESPIKYNPNGYIGPMDNKITLDLEDDAAHIKWGNNWRMPTKEELDELICNCSWNWSTRNGIGGFLVTSKVAELQNQTLFLPASGHAAGTDHYNKGKYGFYWSKSINHYYGMEACCLSFSDWSDIAHLASIPRCYGFPIRPVYGIK